MKKAIVISNHFTVLNVNYDVIFIDVSNWTTGRALYGDTSTIKL